MELLIFALVVAIIACILVAAVRSIPMPTPVNWIVPVVILLLAAVLILGRMYGFH